MPQIELYTKQNCAFCRNAKELLRQKGQTFLEFDVEQDPTKLREMLERSQGRKTVPEIFIDGNLIGGFDELRRLDSAGQLDEILGLTGATQQDHGQPDSRQPLGFNPVISADQE